jgi:hypothetical protein
MRLYLEICHVVINSNTTNTTDSTYDEVQSYCLYMIRDTYNASRCIMHTPFLFHMHFEISLYIIFHRVYCISKHVVSKDTNLHQYERLQYYT